MKRLLRSLWLAVCALLSGAGFYYAVAVNESLPRAEAQASQKTPKVEFSGIVPTLTNSASVTFQVTVSDSAAGDLTPIVNNRPQAAVSTGTAISVPLVEGVNTVSVQFTPKNTADFTPAQSESRNIRYDKTGPILQHAELVELPSRGTTLLVNFAEEDLPDSLPTAAFRVARQADDASFPTGATHPIQGVPEIQGRTVRLFFGTLPGGVYRLTVVGSAPASKDGSASSVFDRAGNPFNGGVDKTWDFTVPGDRRFGKHVEFPPYAPPKKQQIPAEGFNPADFVETRVARLYYYRDAHRVAEIINRNVRSLNQAAVTLAERRAEKARDDFDDKVDKRRKAERMAVQAAETARNAESKLAGAREVAGITAETDSQIAGHTERKKQIDAVLGSIKPLQEETVTKKSNFEKADKTAGEKDAVMKTAQANLKSLLDTPTPADPTQANDLANKRAAAQNAKDMAEADAKQAHDNAATAKAQLDDAVAKLAAESARINEAGLRKESTQVDADLVRLNAQKSRLPTGDSLKQAVTQMESSVSNLRQTELAKSEESHDAQAAEDRAAKTRFRAEVTAAETDPDTYVAGDLTSVDPVTQVSISVIGEGLIQLRGPIKGINKIRTMINEIDSPVGQIKIGIFSVQVNGEKGEQMEKVVGDAEGHIDLSRFLVNQSLENLRRAIQSEAANIAAMCDQEGHYQVDRDRRYLYTFFGRDFIDELYEMNSEFLFTENKLLSLHAMDTVSLNRALFILALAKNDIRERIIAQFLEASHTELADAEYDYRRSSELKPHKTEKQFPSWNRTHLPVWNHYHKEEMVYEAVHRNAQQRYHFRNVRSFFDAGFANPDTMNPVQREFIRLAQIFKARLVAEMELKQRVIERGLIEDRSSDDDFKFEKMNEVHRNALTLETDIQRQRVDAFRAHLKAIAEIDQIVSEVDTATQSLNNAVQKLMALNTQLRSQFSRLSQNDPKVAIALHEPNDANSRVLNDIEQRAKELRQTLAQSLAARWTTATDRNVFQAAVGNLDDDLKALGGTELTVRGATRIASNLATTLDDLRGYLEKNGPKNHPWNAVRRAYVVYRDNFERYAAESVNHVGSQETAVRATYNDLTAELAKLTSSDAASSFLVMLDQAQAFVRVNELSRTRLAMARQIAKDTRADLDHRKLLNHMIDEQEDKFIELVEGTRAHIAVIDHYLKRLSIALEDDFKVQFYDPAFIRIREAARQKQVNLGQVERTTILTNNRAFAKVDPQATMEFDLPKRQIAIKEAFDAAKALVEDTGALVKDPTFLAAFQMMGGGSQPSTVKNVVPGQSLSTNQQDMGLAPRPEPTGTPGSSLQSLVPEPAIFKLETGTGFQIRPVIQPDGDSVVYDFDYMYTTNIREPVRADEKHIGRIKRHFVHTEVQTGNFEMREISRYLVALKVSRTAKGVPLLENVPLVGAAFRPAPSAESSIQQNIILGQTTVYPTLFDLMGLRWAQQVVDLDHVSLLESEHVVRGRQKSIRDYVFRTASQRVDDILDVSGKTPENSRPDLYHSQSQVSPFHPNGFQFEGGVKDPTGNKFERNDKRPADFQVPPYERYRHRPAYPETIDGPSIEPWNARESKRTVPQLNGPQEPIQRTSWNVDEGYEKIPNSLDQGRDRRIPRQGISAPAASHGKSGGDRSVAADRAPFEANIRLSHYDRKPEAPPPFTRPSSIKRLPLAE